MLSFGFDGVRIQCLLHNVRFAAREVLSTWAFRSAAFSVPNAGSRSAGWQLYLHYAFDQTKTRDVLRLGNQRSKNDLAAATLYWKVNNLVSFVLEESMYRTRIADPTNLDPRPPFMRVSRRGSGTTSVRSWANFLVLGKLVLL